MSIINYLKRIILSLTKKYYRDLTNNQILIKIIKTNISEYTATIYLNIDNKKSIISSSILNEIIKDLKQDQIIDNISINNSNSVCITINKEYLESIIYKIVSNNKNTKKEKSKKEKIIIKYNSSNPHDSLNINDIRRIIYCDNLYRIMNYCGYEVNVEYSINNNKLTNNQNTNISFDNIKKDLENYRVYFDSYSDERIRSSNIIEKMLTEIKYTNYCYISNNELWLKTTEYGDTEDIKLIEKNGEYTEEIIELSYYYTKCIQNYNLLINISNDDNYEKIQRIKSFIKIIKKELYIIDIPITEEINNNIEILNKTNINNIRYILAKYNQYDKIDIETELINNKSSEKSIDYIENAINTISSFLRKKRNIFKKLDKYNTLNSDIAYTIIDKISEYDDIIIDACNKQNPSIITKYIYELTSIYHIFCENEDIITNNEEYTNERLNILLAIKIVLNNSLDLIGIIPIEEI